MLTETTLVSPYLACMARHVSCKYSAAMPGYVLRGTHPFLADGTPVFRAASLVCWMHNLLVLESKTVADIQQCRSALRCPTTGACPTYLYQARQIYRVHLRGQSMRRLRRAGERPPAMFPLSVPTGPVRYDIVSRIGLFPLSGGRDTFILADSNLICCVPRQHPFPAVHKQALDWSNVFSFTYLCPARHLLDWIRFAVSQKL